MKRLAPYFSKKTLNFGLDETLTLLDSRPQTSSDKNIQGNQGRDDQEAPSNPNPKNNEKRLAPSKKTLNFGLDENPNPTRLTSQTSSDKNIHKDTKKEDDRRATV
jgi:hypothetical protein